MSLHEFDRAGLGTIHVLHCPTHSLSTVLPKPDRLPLAEKSNNVQQRRSASKSAKPRPATPVVQEFEATIDPSFTFISLPRPSTPFEPLPPLLATSPLRLSSFLDTALLSEPEIAPPQSPSPQPTRRTPKKLELPSLFHPNSPYAPWTSDDRRAFLRPLTPASQFSAYSRPYSRSGARAPEPESPLPAPKHNKFLRISKSFKNLRRTVTQGVRHAKNALCKKASKTPQLAQEPLMISPPPIPPLPSPVQSCGSSAHTTTLAEWLRDCEASIERTTHNQMTLEEYEERGSWMDLTSLQDESEIHSFLMPTEDDDPAERYAHSNYAPASPTCTNTSTILPLSMGDVWPAPPQSVTPSRVFSRQMSMPGGWTFRDSPA